MANIVVWKIFAVEIFGYAKLWNATTKLCIHLHTMYQHVSVYSHTMFLSVRNINGCFSQTTCRLHADLLHSILTLYTDYRTQLMTFPPPPPQANSTLSNDTWCSDYYFFDVMHTYMHALTELSSA